MNATITSDEAEQARQWVDAEKTYRDMHERAFQIAAYLAGLKRESGMPATPTGMG